MTNMQNNTDENFNEDFERLLKQFVSEKYKDVKRGSGKVLGVFFIS